MNQITSTSLRYTLSVFNKNSTLKTNGGGGGGGEGGEAGWGGGTVDAGCVESLLAAALSRVMCAAVPIPDVADASVSHSAVVGRSVVGVVGLL